MYGTADPATAPVPATVLSTKSADLGLPVYLSGTPRPFPGYGRPPGPPSRFLHFSPGNVQEFRLRAYPLRPGWPVFTDVKTDHTSKVAEKQRLLYGFSIRRHTGMALNRQWRHAPPLAPKQAENQVVAGRSSPRSPVQALTILATSHAPAITNLSFCQK